VATTCSTGYCGSSSFTSKACWSNIIVSIPYRGCL
jgi:hypothetical protein